MNQWRGWINIIYIIENRRLNLKYEGSEFTCSIVTNEKEFIEQTNIEFNNELDAFFESIEEIFT
jgi:hypothetical protein